MNECILWDTKVALEKLPGPLVPGTLKLRFLKRNSKYRVTIQGGGLSFWGFFAPEGKCAENQGLKAVFASAGDWKDNTALSYTLTEGSDDQLLISGLRGRWLQKRMDSVCFLPWIWKQKVSIWARREIWGLVAGRDDRGAVGRSHFIAINLDEQTGFRPLLDSLRAWSTFF